MLDETRIVGLSRGYACRAAAGPAWRAASAYGFDMSLIEDAWILSKEAAGREHNPAAVRQPPAIQERRRQELR